MLFNIHGKEAIIFKASSEGVQPERTTTSGYFTCSPAEGPSPLGGASGHHLAGHPDPALKLRSVGAGVSGRIRLAGGSCSPFLLPCLGLCQDALLPCARNTPCPTLARCSRKMAMGTPALSLKTASRCRDPSGGFSRRKSLQAGSSDVSPRIPSEQAGHLFLTRSPCLHERLTVASAGQCPWDDLSCVPFHGLGESSLDTCS